jgi:hypothetical protein
MENKPFHWDAADRSLMALGLYILINSQVSHPDMRLVSAAIGASYPLYPVRTLVHAGFRTFKQSHDLRKDSRIFLVRA